MEIRKFMCIKKKYYKNITIQLFLYYNYLENIDFFSGNNKIYMKKLQKNLIYSSMKNLELLIINCKK